MMNDDWDAAWKRLEEWDACWKHLRKAVEASILRDKRGTRLRGIQRFKTPNKILLRRRQR